MTGVAMLSIAQTLGGAPAEEPLVQGSKEWEQHVPATAVDAKDADTPDAWIPRDPRIQRLTGRHPLNCEPPMDVLMEAGFITPPSLHVSARARTGLPACAGAGAALHSSCASLQPAPCSQHLAASTSTASPAASPASSPRPRRSACASASAPPHAAAPALPPLLLSLARARRRTQYVRNHGAVPRLSWDTHTVTINGLVQQPLTLSMDQLVGLPSVTLPVTLVCAGNRRKEENMHKKSIGFNWGPCAVSTSYWTGVRLGDLLRQAGVTPGAGHVCFRGPTGELPKGADGSYGACGGLLHRCCMRCALVHTQCS